MKRYIPKEFEHKWVKIWDEEKIYKKPTIKKGDDKFYSLYSFPYPSGAGLHVGHVEGMVANDIAARFARMNGKATVLPMGWDSFGLPAENYAIKTGIHPKDSTDEVVVTFKDQINKIGISVDWDTEVGAHWPEYYKWTQWIFLQLFKEGLAYQKEAPVNWCPSCQTVLANEQVVDGKCERCGTEVIQKNMKQWFFKITEYADRLEADLDKVDWPKSTKEQQRNWIGKSIGAEINFKVEGSNEVVTVFTTRPDTIYGATYMVLAPEHELVTKIVSSEQKNTVTEYIENTKKKTELQRTGLEKDKSGVFTGAYAINPFNGKKMPIWIGDHVLITYGTGAIMAVPAHDERDFAFAHKYDIPVVKVVEGGETLPFTEEGTVVNSELINGLKTKEAKVKIISELEKRNIGKGKTTYRLRDWLVSRQRYWGAPIPVVYDPEGNAHAVDESDLPVLLPYDVNFKPTGESPLKYSEEFHKSAEEKYGKGWRREVDTMDTFVDSSWYFFRHLSANDDKKVFDSEQANAWLPTDLYMIGAEHIVLHLLYSRFFTKFFFDKKMIDFDEPFYTMRHMGTILGPDGRKMSKRWGNVINPTDVIQEFGADTLRIYEMFMGPLDQSKPWDPKNVHGAYRFLNRVWNMFHNNIADASQEDKNVIVKLQKTIQKVTADTPELKFNTAIASMMEFINEWENKKIRKENAKNFLKLLAPYAPFIAEEIWKTVFEERHSIHSSEWPKVDETLLKEETITIPVQINGKVRSTIEISAKDTDQEVIVKKALQDEKVSKFVTSADYKVIYIPKRILNLIVK